MKLKRTMASSLALCMALSTLGTIAFADEADVITLDAGTYTWSSDYAGKTVKAADDAEVVLDMTVNGTPGLGGSDVTFEGITFEWGNTGYKGLQHSGDLTYIDCTINGQPFLYGETETFVNCTFNQEISDNYNVWTYSAKEISFIDCTFNCAGRSVLIYSELQANVVNFENTTFNSTTAVDGKAAIEIGPKTMSGNTIITIDELTTAEGFGNGSVSGNPLWNVKNDPTIANSAAIVSVAEETVYSKVVNSAGVVADIVAEVGGEYYNSLDEAIAAAADEQITLLANAELNTKLKNATVNIDLNGYTMNVNTGSNYIIGENSISNGTIDISNASSSQNIFGLAQYQTPATTLTLDNVNFIGDGFDSGYAVFEIGNSGADVALTITNSNIDLKNDNASQGGFVKGYGPNCVLTITNTEVTLDNTDMFNVNIAANITDSKFTISNLSATAFRNLGGTIDNTVISVTNSENGIRNSSAGYDITVKNNSSIKISGSTGTEAGKTGDMVLADGNKVDVDTTSELLVETSDVANADDVTGNVISKAETVYVQYKKTDIDANDNDTVEGSDTYEIVLAGYNDETINELASADLTFNFVPTAIKGGALNYTVAPAKGVSLTQLGERYMFNYNGVDKYEESGKAIVIGTITIDGYGAYTLGTKDVTTNAVYATEIRDNIVDGFTPAAGLVINEDMIADDGMVGEITNGNIAVPDRNLAITIDFPNAVNDQVKAYQDMKVVISGGDLAEDITIDLGKDAAETKLDIFGKADAKFNSTMDNGSYKINVTDALTLNNAYTVTVSGAGYRTARYTVTMTDDKALRFWNNVMDENQIIETGKDSSTAKVTFLAGDIVKDNNINIYDLSAVVSYFGTETKTEAFDTYAKYDLNRDGVIDSKDVAYVLVSWNN